MLEKSHNVTETNLIKPKRKLIIMKMPQTCNHQECQVLKPYLQISDCFHKYLFLTKNPIFWVSLPFFPQRISTTMPQKYDNAR